MVIWPEHVSLLATQLDSQRVFSAQVESQIRLTLYTRTAISRFHLAQVRVQTSHLPRPELIEAVHSVEDATISVCALLGGKDDEERGMTVMQRDAALEGRPAGFTTSSRCENQRGIIYGITQSTFHDFQPLSDLAMLVWEELACMSGLISISWSSWTDLWEAEDFARSRRIGFGDEDER